LLSLFTTLHQDNHCNHERHQESHGCRKGSTLAKAFPKEQDTDSKGKNRSYQQYPSASKRSE